jgi:hypothetical protein
MNLLTVDHKWQKRVPEGVRLRRFADRLDRRRLFEVASR